MAEDLRLITAFGGETIHADKLIELCSDEGVAIDNIHVAPSHAKDSVAFITASGLSVGDQTKLDDDVIAGYTAEPYVTINGNNSFFDPVLSRVTATPPADPDLGDSFIIPANPTGAWSGKTNQLLRWDGLAWPSDKLRKGVRVGILDEGVDVEYDGALWAVHNYGGAAPSLVSYTRTTLVSAVKTTPKTINFDRSNCDVVTGLFAYNGGIFTASKALKCAITASFTAVHVSGTNPVVALEIVKNAGTVLAFDRPSFESSGAKSVSLSASAATTLNINDELHVRAYTSDGEVSLVALTPDIHMTVYEN